MPCLEMYNLPQQLDFSFLKNGVAGGGLRHVFILVFAPVYRIATPNSALYCPFSASLLVKNYMASARIGRI